MSSLIRSLQRATLRDKNKPGCRSPYFVGPGCNIGRGSKLGINNERAKDLVARLSREEKRK